MKILLKKKLNENDLHEFKNSEFYSAKQCSSTVNHNTFLYTTNIRTYILHSTMSEIEKNQGRGRKEGNRNRRGGGNNNSSSSSGTNSKKHKDGNANTTRPPNNKRPKRVTICRNFAKDGQCGFGDNCRFSHETEAVEAGVVSASTVSPEPPIRMVIDNDENNKNSTVAAPVNPNGLAHITGNKFADLNISAESRRAMAEVFKYEFMTAVQAETLPLILKGSSDHQDCLAKAKTGTGKTLAFMIPTIERIMAAMSNRSKNRSDICCLVISPTRELASQIGAETEKLLSFHKKEIQKVVVCVGGTNKNKDVRSLAGTTPIVVATPGRLLDHLQNGGLAERMARLDSLILDEADQLLDMGFRPDIERILRLLQPSRQTRQTLLFSATIPDSVSEIANIALRKGYNFVDTVGQESEQTHKHVQQQVMITPQELQIQALANILERETNNKPYKIMVFFTTARLTGFMAELFNSVSSQTGYDVLEIHSRKSQKQREKASDKFRKQKNAIMFSSDVTARGMDYPDVTFVLQIGLTDRSQYIHRLGRTARAGKDGKGGLLLTDYEEFHMVKKELNDMPLEMIPVPKYERASSAAATGIQNVCKIEGLRIAAEQAYRAWLGYYNGHLKKVNWDKRTMVQQGNKWGQQIGLKEQPGIQKRTIGKMGLKGVPGVKIEN
jgi:ATP-dependent RNA helicase MSS116